jgi:hypothetical protein
MEHRFTQQIYQCLQEQFKEDGLLIYEKSELLQYLNLKTHSVDKGSKSRSSFANIYAIYVLLEDYVKQSFHLNTQYSQYEGAQFTLLLQKQRTLPFGSKLQNHALNHRMNEEFRKYFQNCEYIPILRNATTNRYWFNENLLNIRINKQSYNIALVTLQIIEAYIQIKKSNFEHFIETCNTLQTIEQDGSEKARQFIINLLAPHVDARLFEIVSYAILKRYYQHQKIYFGFDLDTIQAESLKLFKTGRTNANDGGIDFVMKPLGRFYQVTESLDFKKYFLDIDKIEHFPLTFVIKSNQEINILISKIEEHAQKLYSIDAIVHKYMNCIEELINIPKLIDIFTSLETEEDLSLILKEILKQSKLEFNYMDDAS